MFFCQNLLRMVVYINFCLFPLNIACSLLTMSVKNQAKLARKILGSYSRGFTVSQSDTVAMTTIFITPPFKNDTCFLGSMRQF